jgi:ABC-type sugar transport system substrate-binding protein
MLIPATRSRICRARARTVLALGAAAVTVLTGACSAPGSGGGGGSGASSQDNTNPAAMSQAQDTVDALTKPPTYKGPTAPVDLSKVRGKTVYFIAFDLSNAFNKAILDNFTEAAKLMDVRVVGLSGQVNPGLENTYVNQAVQNKAAAIVLLSVGAEQVPAALAKAADAHIPVITLAQRSAGQDPGKNVSNQVNVNTTDIGKAQVDLAYVMSKGNIHAVGYGGKSLPQDVSQWEGQAAEIKSLCPDKCTYTNKNIDLTNFQTQLPTIARSAIVADSQLNWFFPTWDILAGYLVPGIQQANAQSKVQFSSWNGIPAAMDLVKQGKQAATFGVPLRWWGWATADMAARYIAGQTVAPDAENMPVRMFTKEILDKAGSTTDEQALYQDDSVFDTYKKLWGLS